MAKFHGLTYQFKYLLTDKVVLIGMLLPLVLALGVRFIPADILSQSVSLQTVMVQNSLDAELQDWLEANTSLVIVDSHDQLTSLVLVPSTEVVGVVPPVKPIDTKSVPNDLEPMYQVSLILAGDESSYTKSFVNNFHDLITLPIEENPYVMALEDQKDQFVWLRQFFIAVVLLTACFIGSSFNAITMVSEKESGVFIVHGVLPLGRFDFVLQRIVLGFVVSTVVVLLTWIIMLGVGVNIIVAFPLLLLASYFSAILGLYIAHGAKDYLGVIVTIKFVLILFLAIPIVGVLVGTGTSWYPWVYWIMPSVPVFQAITQFTGSFDVAYVQNLGVLLLHCMLWTLIYVVMLYRRLQFW